MKSSELVNSLNWEPLFFLALTSVLTQAFLSPFPPFCLTPGLHSFFYCLFPPIFLPFNFWWNLANCQQSSSSRRALPPQATSRGVTRTEACGLGSEKSDHSLKCLNLLPFNRPGLHHLLHINTEILMWKKKHLSYHMKYFITNTIKTFFCWKFSLCGIHFVESQSIGKQETLF